MFTRHVTDELTPHIDGELAPADAARLERHLAICSPCRQVRADVVQGLASMDDLPQVEAPDTIWFALEDALRESRRPATNLRWMLAAAAVLLLGSLVYWGVARRATGWIETSATSRKTLTIGGIGSVELSPNTRIRIVADRPTEHRMALAHGEIRAKISAPPRLFFVETASGTAVDLGCEYTLTADERGTGFLRVAKGWVSYQWNGRESLVPAGASCRTHTQSGPGTPYFDDAPDKLR